MASTRAYEQRVVDVNGTRTNYLEAGADNDQAVVLIHSGEFGGAAEMSWERNIAGLAEEFHVIAPDLLGYGDSEKLFSFEDQFDLRVRHIRDFLDVLRVDSAHFVGNSMGAGYVGSVACEDEPLAWDIDKIVMISGDGQPPQGFGDIIKNFDGSRDSIEDILGLLFYDEWYDDEYVDRKLAYSRQPGHWQCTAGVRFDPPFEQDLSFRRRKDYEHIDVPTLIVGGVQDPVKPAEDLEALQETVSTGGTHTEIELFDEAQHCAHIEHPDAFNDRVIEFLRSD